MKQIKIFGAVAAAILMLLTSCLGDSSDSGELYGVPGKIRYSNGKMLIDSRSGTLYTTQLSSLEYYDGDWLYVSFSYDMDSEENTSGNDYTYVTLLQNPDKISEGMVYSTDTTQIMTNEIAVTTPAENVGYYQYFDYMDGDLLMCSTFSELTDAKASFYMYYDYNQEPYVHESKNTYTFYIRAIKTYDGKTPTINHIMPNYYRIESYINSINSKEKSAGKSEYCIAFRYVDEIDSESGEFSWKTGIPVTFSVASE